MTEIYMYIYIICNKNIYVNIYVYIYIDYEISYNYLIIFFLNNNLLSIISNTSIKFYNMITNKPYKIAEIGSSSAISYKC